VADLQPLGVDVDDRLHALRLPEDSSYRGQPLSDLPLQGVVITALMRAGQRRLQPTPETLLEGNDTLVLFGPPEALARAETRLLASVWSRFEST